MCGWWSGGCRLAGALVAVVEVFGDGVASGGEAEHDENLTRSVEGDHATAVKGAIENVVAAFGVFAPSVAAVVHAVAARGRDVLAEVFASLESASTVVVGVVYADQFECSAVRGDLLVPPIGSVGVSSSKDAPSGAWSEQAFSTIGDVDFVWLSAAEDEVVRVAAAALLLLERGCFHSAMHGREDCEP